MKLSVVSAKLGDPGVASVILGQSPPSSAYNEIGDGLPFFQGKVDFQRLHPVPRIWCTDGRKFAEPGDILTSVRAPVGDGNVATDHCAIGRGLAAVRPGPDSDSWFLYFALLYSKPSLEAMATGSTFVSVNKNTLNGLDIPFFDGLTQAAIGNFLRSLVYRIEQEDETFRTAQALKRAAMHTLFTRGLRGEAQKETEIGPVPESWLVQPMEEVAQVYSSSRLTYSEMLGRADESIAEYGVRVLGIKVKDMTQSDPEVPLSDAELSRMIPVGEAQLCCIAPGAIVFPKNGAAVATNKKRVVSEWCVLDPNVMALHAKDTLEQSYLYQWMQIFDLSSIQNAGPVPNFGKGAMSKTLLPVPSPNEQCEIVAILNAIDRKIDLHRRKRTVLEKLFKALLHKLMTGEIRVRELDISEILHMTA